MTVAADFNPELRPGGTGLEGMATGAGYSGVVEPGVNVSFHGWRSWNSLDWLALS
jgi:hypothetical protein